MSNLLRAEVFTMAGVKPPGALIWAMSRHLTSSDDLPPPKRDLWPQPPPIHLPTLPIDRSTLKLSPNTHITHYLLSRCVQTDTHKTNKNVCTQNKLTLAHVHTNTSAEISAREGPVSGIVQRLVGSGLLCHACVNLSRALWTLLSSQYCWCWPVFVRVDIYYKSYKPM